jgi:hypothetical protein
MKYLLTLSAVIEAGAGLALLGFPSETAALLLGSGLDAPAAVALGRLAGAALCALGVACWLAHRGVQSGVITAMSFYNVGAVVILGVAGVELRPVGAALWPAVVLHAAMAVWCVASLVRKLAKTTEKTKQTTIDSIEKTR